MFKEEDIESWNELFPEGKIHESDLSHPTDLFLVRTLIPYLKMFGYKVVPPFPTHQEINLTISENLNFLIQLTRQIQKILKIPSQANTFTYADLIAPTPKKTSKILCILLNYAYYFQTYKDDVFQMGFEKIQEREMMLRNIDDMKKIIEERKNFIEEIKTEIATQSDKLEKVNQEVQRLQKFCNKHKREETTLQKTIAELDIKLNDLNEKKLTEKKKIVPDAEAVALQTQVDKVQNHIDEIAQQKSTLESAILDCNYNINTMEDLLKTIEEVKHIVPMKLITNYKDIHEKFNQKKTKFQTLQNKMKELLEKNEEIQASNKILEGKCISKKKQFEQEKKQRMKSIETEKKKINDNALLLLKLKEEEHSLACSIEEQKDIKEMLANDTLKLMFDYKKI